MTKRSWSVDSLVLIFSIIILAQLLVYIVPQGQFEREPGVRRARTSRGRIHSPPFAMVAVAAAS